MRLSYTKLFSEIGFAQRPSSVLSYRFCIGVIVPWKKIRQSSYIVTHTTNSERDSIKCAFPFIQVYLRDDFLDYDSQFIKYTNKRCDCNWKTKEIFRHYKFFCLFNDQILCGIDTSIRFFYRNIPKILN